MYLKVYIFKLPLLRGFFPPFPKFSPFLSLFQTDSWLCVSLLLEKSVAGPKATVSKGFTKPKPMREHRTYLEERKREREFTNGVSWKKQAELRAFPSLKKGLPLGERWTSTGREKTGSLKPQGQGGAKTQKAMTVPF